tara:strand:- start:1060 stop:1986 length:927 start_codon:yes stop_codon:yes gene_type:complete
MSIVVLKRKAQRMSRNAPQGTFRLNMSNQGKKSCCTHKLSTPKPAPQKSYKNYLKEKVRYCTCTGDNVVDKYGVGKQVVVRKPEMSSSEYLENKKSTHLSLGCMDEKIIYNIAVAPNNQNVNKYYINNTLQGTLQLQRTKLYEFKFNHNNVAHPFYLTVGAAHTSDKYTDGILVYNNSRLVIKVPNDAPNTLYYNCGHHANMGGSANIITKSVQTCSEQPPANISSLQQRPRTQEHCITKIQPAPGKGKNFVGKGANNKRVCLTTKKGLNVMSASDKIARVKANRACLLNNESYEQPLPRKAGCSVTV